MAPNHSAKNARIIDGLSKQASYYLLSDGFHYRSFIQVGQDKVPLPVLLNWYGTAAMEVEPLNSDQLLEKLEELIGYKPEVVLQRDTRIRYQSHELRTEIVNSMLTSIEDDPAGLGQWEINSRGGITVTVRFSRDPRLSSNGGDYFYYRSFEKTGTGILSSDSNSSDFNFDADSIFYHVKLSDLEELMTHCATIAMNVLQGEMVTICPCCAQKITYHEENEQA